MAIKVTKQGRELLRDPLLNKGTAFSDEEKNTIWAPWVNTGYN